MHVFLCFFFSLFLEATNPLSYLQKTSSFQIICTGPRDLADGCPILEDLRFIGESHSIFIIFIVFYQMPQLQVHDRIALPRIQPRGDFVYMPFSSGIHGKRKGILTSHYIMNAKAMISFKYVLCILFIKEILLWIADPRGFSVLNPISTRSDTSTPWQCCLSIDSLAWRPFSFRFLLVPPSWQCRSSVYIHWWPV